MPVRHPAVKRLPAALLSLAATLALSALFLTACAATSSANEFSSTSIAPGFAAISNIPGAPYSWTDNLGNLFDGQGSGVRTAQLNDRWEFRPATELWSWVGASSAKDEIYLAAMPELSPVANTWTWAPESDTAVAGIIPGARCHTVNWIESGGNSWLACGDDLQANASINDLWRFGP